MTAFAPYTRVSTPRYEFNQRQVAAAAALVPGDLYTMGDGIIGAFVGNESAAIGDPVIFYTTGVFDVKCNAASDTYADGAAVYFDTVNKVAVTAASATCLFMGTAIGAKASGPATVRVCLNGNIAPSLAGAATATTLSSGNITGTGTLALTGAATLSSTLSVAAMATLTGGATLGAKLSLKTIATPVAATGAAGGVAGAAALGACTVAFITSDGATKGVKFPTSIAGETRIVINNSGTAALLFAASGGTTNGQSADAGVTIPASTGVIAFSTAADTWIVHALTAKAANA